MEAHVWQVATNTRYIRIHHLTSCEPIDYESDEYTHAISIVSLRLCISGLVRVRYPSNRDFRAELPHFWRANTSKILNKRNISQVHHGELIFVITSTSSSSSNWNKPIVSMKKVIRVSLR